MKVLVVSDNHGRTGILEQAIELQKPFDAMIHCGDFEGTEDIIESMIDCPHYFVAGNNDFYSNLPYEELVQFGKYTVWVHHGNLPGLWRGEETILREMEKRGADIAILGHTHYPSIQWFGEKAIVNPGSISLPRQPGHRPSYLLMEFDREGEVHFTNCFL